MNHRRFRSDQSLNAGSMADVAFLLLLFFLVATTIENPTGIQVLLPRYEETPPQQINENRVLTVKINKSNQVMVESTFSRIDNISGLVQHHINERLGLSDQPIVSLVTDTAAVYSTYIAVYDEIKAAYTNLRNEAAQAHYKKDFDVLDKSQRKVIIRQIPMIISEADYY